MLLKLLRNPVTAWRDMAPFIGASGRRVAVIVVSSLGRAAGEAFVLVLIARIALTLSEGDDQLTVRLVGSNVSLTLGEAVWVGFGLTAIILLFSVVLAHATASLVTDAVANARRLVLESYLWASWDLQARERTGHLQDLLTSYVSRVATALSTITTGLTAALSLAALLAAAFVANALAALSMVVAVSVVMALMQPLSKASRQRSREHGLTNRRFAMLTTEAVGIAEEIRVFGATTAVGERLGLAVQHARRTQFAVQFIRKLVPAVYQSAGMALIVLGLGAVVTIRPDDIAGLAVVVLLFVRGVSYGQQLQTVLQQANEVLPHIQELRLNERRYRNARLPSDGRSIGRIGPLEFEQVSYQYPGGALALSDLSCRIHDGEMIGIVGPSGSGKSTFVQLLLRLRGQTDGQLRANGEPVDAFSLASWYERIALVPQHAHLFEGSVAENIGFFRDVPAAAIRDAATRAQIHDEIEAMPQGYDTLISGVGGSVSGGQAQRICIARALVSTPDLVVLDEPTSALDVRSEAAVQDVLAAMKGTATMVIIAHRLSTLRLCDRIMVLEEGRLEAFEPAAVLLESDGFYREAFELSQL